jgi:hypothetical protein
MDIKILLGTFIRHLLNGAAAWLVLKGVIPAEAVSALLDASTGMIVGALGLAGAYVWSLISKKKALDTPPAP